MFQLLILALLTLPQTVFASALDNPNHWQESIERCQTHPDNSQELLSSEFKWGYTLLEMQDQFEETYESGKRLWLHAQYDNELDSFMIYDNSDRSNIKPVAINRNFIRSITRQIETALKKGYASYVFFPDMGHAHLYFKEDHWLKNYQALSTSGVQQKHLLFEKMFADPELKALYHLSEQLEFKDEHGHLHNDEVLNFKYWTRNFLGQNNQSDLYDLPISKDLTKFNTVVGLPGYSLYSSGFAISSSAKGCFPYKDQNGVIRYFDISLHDPRPDMNDPSVYM